MKFRTLIALSAVTAAMPFAAHAADAKDAAESVDMPEFSSLTLEDALAYSAMHNPDLLMTKEQIKEQEGVLIQVAAAEKPNLMATSYISKEKEVLQQIPGYTSESWQVKVTATQLIYDGGSVRNGKRAQREAIEMARLDYLAHQQNVMLKVKQDYYSVLLNKELIAVQEESIAVLETVLDQAQKRFNEGKGTKFDVIRAEAAVANARPRLINVRNDYQVAQDSLLASMGVKTANQERSELKLGSDFKYSDAMPTLESSIVAAEENRPELERQDHVIEACRYGEKAIQATAGPRVSAGVGYEYTGDYTTTFFRETIPGWSASVQASWSLFDGREREGRLAQARSQEKQAKFAKDQMSLAIDLEVRQSYSELDKARQLLSAAKTTIAEAQESLRLAQASEREGKATQLDVLSAQSVLTEARSDLSTARFSCAVAQARLDKATGSRSL